MAIIVSMILWGNKGVGNPRTYFTKDTRLLLAHCAGPICGGKNDVGDWVQGKRDVPKSCQRFFFAPIGLLQG